MFVTTSRFWLGWLALMCVGIVLCTRQASEVYKQRNVTKEFLQVRMAEKEESKPQNEVHGAGSVAMKSMFNRDAVLGPQQPDHIEGPPTQQDQQQEQQDKRNYNDDNDSSTSNNNNNNNIIGNNADDDAYEDDEEDDEEVKLLEAQLGNGGDYDKARRLRWVENVCAFIRRPLVDYIYQQVMDARLQKLELETATQLPDNSHRMRLHRHKRQPDDDAASANGPEASFNNNRRTPAPRDLKKKLIEILNMAIGSANAAMPRKEEEKEEYNGGGEAGGGDGDGYCSCHQQLRKSTNTFASKF